jgi:hypothetical protein
MYTFGGAVHNQTVLVRQRLNFVLLGIPLHILGALASSDRLAGLVGLGPGQTHGARYVDVRFASLPQHFVYRLSHSRFMTYIYTIAVI